METKLITFLTTIACSFPSILIGQIKNSISQIFAEPIFNGETISEPVYAEPLNLRSENFRHNCNHYEYFVNLGNHIGYNEKQATCGYVALAMLLCYYDTYYNPNIVSDSYTAYGNNSISPGTNIEPASNTTNIFDYYDFLRNHKDTCLHSYLVLKGKGALLSNPQSVAANFQYEFGTSESIITSLANSYLGDLNISNYTINSISKPEGLDMDQAEEIHDFIISEINAGRPVFAGYNNHAQIIYGYDDTKYYVHKGYVGQEQSTYSHGRGLSYSTQDFAAISIHFESSPHVHSYNYFDDGVGNYYCACGTYKPVHVHDYTDHYVYFSSNYHLSYCACGAHITELHSYRINLHNNPCVCGGSVWGN